MPQLVTRLDERLVEEVDALVAAGVVTSRSDAVRVALVRLVDDVRRRRVGAAIVSGYERKPQAPSDVAWSDESTKAMIAEEPW